MKKNIKNLETSIRAKLQNKARETNHPFSAILQYYGMERFIYRFSLSQYADKFVLKGALMFVAWQMPKRRTTLDIDFLAYYDNQTTAIEKVIKDICKIKVEQDGLVFDSSTVKGEKIKEDAVYEGVRVKLTGFLGCSRIPMQIDIAFDDIVYPGIITVDYPVILDLPVPHLKGYPTESMISEKFEAMVKLGVLNSRMKDFYDIWLMMHSFNFYGARLSEAFRKTFTHRNTSFPMGKQLFPEEIYNENSDRQTLWNAFLKKEGISHVPDKLSKIAKEIEPFIVEPLNAIKEEEKFNKIWKAPGPWR